MSLLTFLSFNYLGKLSHVKTVIKINCMSFVLIDVPVKEPILLFSPVIMSFVLNEPPHKIMLV